MKIFRSTISVILMLVILLLLSSCASISKVYQLKYSVYPGEVLRQFDLSEADLKQFEVTGLKSDNLKDTGLDMSFFGANFDLILELAAFDCVGGFIYHTFLDNKEDVAAVISSISAKSTQLYGKSLDWICGNSPHYSEEHTKEDLEELYISSPSEYEGDCYNIEFTSIEKSQELLPPTLENSILYNTWGEDITLSLTAIVSYSDLGVRIILQYHPFPPEYGTTISLF